MKRHDLILLLCCRKIIILICVCIKVVVY
ncbi:hypothetical protein ACFW04_010406 [Cataglyphis niger]